MQKKNIVKLKIPKTPGVYFFRQGGRIIYIGKATELSGRVRSYFGEDLIQTRGPVILEMVFCADKLDWQQTESVLEALILEAKLIKKYQPKFNTKEKSDKSFLYVAISKETMPRILLVRGKDLEQDSKTVRGVKIGSTYGPFTNGTQLREALKIIRKIFPYLEEKSKNSYEFYRQMGLAPDLHNPKMYLENIKNIKLFFQGEKKKILRNLVQEMSRYAKERKFEEAGEVKRQIFALKHINDIALLKLEPSAYSLAPNFRIEAYDIAHISGKSMVGVMTVVSDGNVAKSEYRKFKIRTQSDANDTGALKEVIDRRLVHSEWPYPNLIVVDGGVAQMNAAQGVINLVGAKIPVVAVVKDERHRPKNILGNSKYVKKFERAILLANSEAHRFAISYHKKTRGKNFLPQ